MIFKNILLIALLFSSIYTQEIEAQVGQCDNELQIYSISGCFDKCSTLTSCPNLFAELEVQQFCAIRQDSTYANYDFACQACQASGVVAYRLGICTCDNIRCHFGQECIEGVCQPIRRECGTPELGRCPEGFLCIQGECKNRCDFLEEPCEPGHHCVQLRCLPNLFCFTQEDCAAGYVCQNGRCVKICQTILCQEGFLCFQGNCISQVGFDRCRLITCGTGSLCFQGICYPTDGCARITCQQNQKCQAGVCVDLSNVLNLCDTTRCIPPLVCIEGQCLRKQPFACRDIICPQNYFCFNGHCYQKPVIGENPCKDVVCSNDLICRQGECVQRNPCQNVECSDGQRCRGGECVDVEPILCGQTGFCFIGECIDGQCQRPLCGGVVCNLTTHRCRDNQCIDLCENVQCDSTNNQRCINGICRPIPQTCQTFQCPQLHRCIQIQGRVRCVPIISQIQRCGEIVCPRFSECINEVCVNRCDTIDCPDNTRCLNGECIQIPIEDPCNGVECPDNTRCIRGNCETIDQCDGVVCPDNQRCFLGNCVVINPCLGVVCGRFERCFNGRCITFPTPIEIDNVNVDANVNVEVSACVNGFCRNNRAVRCVRGVCPSD